ncbi:hypothetical protein M1D80_24360 [Phyllobacteriaceae bacterium JZ32]
MPARNPPRLLLPKMALEYRRRIQQLYETLQHDSEEKRMEATDAIRSLVDDIVLTRVDDRDRDRCWGGLAGILGLSAKNAKTPRRLRRGLE